MSKNPESVKFYEFCYYRLAAQDVNRFKELAAQHMPRRVKRSKLVGCWLTDLGHGLNRVLHIWEYDSLSHREAVQGDMDSDAQWAGFLEQVRPMFHVMESWLCQALQGDFSTVWSDKDFCKLTALRYKSQADLKYLRQAFKEQTKTSKTENRVRVTFETVIGHDREFFLMEFGSLDLIMTYRSPFSEVGSTDVETSILRPLQWQDWLRQR